MLKQQLDSLSDKLEMELKSGGLGGGDARKGGTGLDEEVANIWGFLQRFADEHAVDKVEVIKSEAEPVQAKIDTLGWLGRYHEFVTLPMVTQVIVAFKDTLMPGNNGILRNNYIQAKHTSHAVLSLVKQIQFLKYKFKEEDGKQKLAVLLSILEPAIVNDENATIGIHIELVELLHDFLSYTLDDYLKHPPGTQKSSKVDQGVPLFLKLTVRCLTSCLRLELGVTRYAKNPSQVADLLKLLHAITDEEVIANGCKCIRISLRDERVSQLKEYIIISTCYRSLRTRMES